MIRNIPMLYLTPSPDFFERIWNILYIHPLTDVFPENIVALLLEGRKLSPTI